MICIVTVYKSPNFGSILQAKVLRDLLLQYDDDVRFVDGNFRPWVYWFQIKSIIRSIFRLEFKKVWYFSYKIVHNYFLWKSFPSIRLSKLRCTENLTFVFGSDEIWNLNRNVCRIPVFWGEGLRGRMVSYAPSINNSTLEQIMSNESFKKNIKKFEYLSTRDEYSKKVLENIYGRPISLVLDPTMLKSIDYYNSSCYKKLPFKYIAVYCFEIGENDINNLKRFAEEKNLKIVLLSTCSSWSDLDVCVETDNPFLYYCDADYVVTNTFHGTAFAINFCKPFVSIARNNKKVTELLTQFNLKDRMVSSFAYEELCDKLNSQISIENIVGPILEDGRKKSMAYIKRILKA